MASLLSPCGNWETLNSAINAGADAVYFGISGMNMRAKARNFELNELKKIVEITSKNNVIPYLAVNTIIFPNEISRMENILISASSQGINHIIAWDAAVLSKAKELGMNITLSTQASCSNAQSAFFYEQAGIKTIVFARELSLENIRTIKKELVEKKSKLKIEAFAHGAMCMAVSGRCFLSWELYGKSGNRGECNQPCRRKYIARDLETGKEVSFGRQTIFSPKDLCTIPILDKLISSGIDILKIEGRNRDPWYVHTVTKCYREAIDAVKNGTFNKELSDKLLSELQTVYNKGYHPGFFLGTPTSDDFSAIENNASSFRKQYVGKVKNYYSKINVFDVDVLSTGFNISDRLLITGPTTGVWEGEILSIQNSSHEAVESTVKGGSYGVKIEITGKIRTGDKVFILRQLP
ncbi:MAG: U32 family peptidase [Deltaproteobacteria bacterium]|nr:U32 family peptidase [Deltaproteobacteria bacterium]